MRFAPMVAVTALGLVGCSDNTLPSTELDLRDLAPVQWTMRVGEERTIEGLRVTFGGVPQDSRCPTEVLCPWSGNAVASIEVGPVTGRGPSFPLSLNTSIEPRHGSAYGLRITLISLRPEPRTPGPIREQDYEAELRASGQ